MAEQKQPSEEELRAALDRVGIVDILLEAAMTTLSLGFRRVSTEARDLAQAKLAIEALRALEPVLREGGVDEAVVRDLEQARSNLQLAFAAAVSEAGAGDSHGAGQDAADPPTPGGPSATEGSGAAGDRSDTEAAGRPDAEAAGRSDAEAADRSDTEAAGRPDAENGRAPGADE